MTISGRVSFILPDQNLAEDLRDLLPGHDVRHPIEMGWDRLENGAILTAAEAAGFAVTMTADKRIRYQQNLVGRRISLVVLSTNHWGTMRANAEPILRALGQIEEGSYQEVMFERRPLQRRPRPERPPGG